MWHTDLFYQLRKMKIRAFDIFRLLLHFTLSSANLVLQYYEAIPVFENKMSILDPIDTKPADSLVRCAMFCGFGCKTFSFNHDAGLCLTYNTCHILNKTVTKMGWQLYNSLSYRKYLFWLLYRERERRVCKKKYV